jgi:uncharacterized protein (TIGR02996 family)
MSAEALFLAILENPEDDLPRLAYADWLDEHGDERRAEFIRVQCRLARLPDNDPDRPALRRREMELIAAHGAGWLEELPAAMRETPLLASPFRRGFPADVTVALKDFCSGGEELFNCAPIESVTVHDLPRRGTGQEKHGRAEMMLLRAIFGSTTHGAADAASAGAADLAGCPALARVREVHLGYNELTADNLAALLDSPHWPTGVIELDLGMNRIGAAGAERLASCPKLSRLTRLKLNGNRIAAAGASALARSPLLPALTALDLSGNELGNAGAEGLMRPSFLARLTALNIAFTGIELPALVALLGSPDLAGLRELAVGTAGRDRTGEGDELVRLLAQAPFVGALRRLHLRGGPLSPVGVGFLACSPLAHGLTDLDLAQQPFGLSGAQALGYWPGGTLRRLDLSGCPLGDDGAGFLASATALHARLQDLDLRGCKIGPRGAAALAGCTFADFCQIDLHENPLGPEGTAALAGSSWLPLLRQLNLRECQVGDEGAEALAGSPGAALCELDLTRNNLTDKGVAALTASPSLARLRKLNLSQNALTDESAEALMRSPFSHALRTLVLHNNPFSEKALERLRGCFGDRLKFRPRSE